MPKTIIYWHMFNFNIIIYVRQICLRWATTFCFILLLYAINSHPSIHLLLIPYASTFQIKIWRLKVFRINSTFLKFYRYLNWIWLICIWIESLIPINTESVIKDADTSISLWMIEVITLVLEDAISERTAKPWAKPFRMKNWTWLSSVSSTATCLP